MKGPIPSASCAWQRPPSSLGPQAQPNALRPTLALRRTLQGPNQLVWCLPTGGYDPRKHASYETCARAELSEEARLAGGAWEPLIPEGHPGIAEVKWCRCALRTPAAADAAVVLCVAGNMVLWHGRVFDWQRRRAMR